MGRPTRWPAVVAGLIVALAASTQPAGATHVYVDDYCVVRDLPTPYQAPADHDLTVLDWSYALDAGYAPPDLVPASRAGFHGVSGTKLVRDDAIDDLAAMRTDALRDGNTIQIQSAYRSYATQAQTFDFWVSQVGYDQALRISARPGHSEHQLGTTIDLTSGGVPPWDYADWGATPTGAWVAANAWRYGFLLSYPAGASAVVCYDHEPWHLRWVGRADAQAQQASGLTLREYLEARLHARFVDIRYTAFETPITWIAERSITFGCQDDPPRHCPTAPVARDQMASFLVRALGLRDGAAVDAFTDDDGSIHERDINRLAHAGLTEGCATGRFCPGEPVRRDQMASFLARAFDLGEGEEVDAFIDDDGSIHEGNINRLAAAGITTGCGGGAYCPDTIVSRGEVAAFLFRALR